MRFRPKFVAKGMFIVTRAFLFSGKNYKPGEVFPWKQLKVSTRRLRCLYDARFLKMGLKDGILGT